ncbi:MAG: proton-conducting transporter membrane subunit [Clostridiales bacterium]|nr:proton-conducting transporter membrane subunit [Clostridiales bacterium]
MNESMILIPVLLPIVAALVMLAIKPFRKNRNGLNLYVIGVTTLVTALTVFACFSSERVKVFEIFSGIDIAFKIDDLSRLFAVLTVAMWLSSSIFQKEYLKHEKDEVRYHFFFLCSLSALLGICFSSNLITMYLFYEMMTLMTFPLVIHSLSKESIVAAMKYIFYSMGGAFLALVGVFYLNRFVDSYEFVAGGQLNAAAADSKSLVLFVVFCMIIGFGSKAGMFPLHGWLPVAHPVAPAPASALMSGNVTKMGVLAVIRVIYYVVGVNFLTGTWVQYAFLSIALLTVVMGSMMAYKEQILKKRLAYSSISQVSYVLFGVALMNPIGLLGGLMHVVYHSIVKNTLFMSAGAIIYKTGKTKVKELLGIGKEMPIVMWCYTIASLTLIGIPPTSAFLSKWYLAEGALNSSTGVIRYLGPVLLIVSALLTAGYLFTITVNGFFPGKDYDYKALEKREPNALMTVPLLTLATAALLFGMFPTALMDFLKQITTTLF